MKTELFFLKNPRLEGILTGTVTLKDPFGKPIIEYDATADSWTEKASFPGSTRIGFTTFTIGSKGYFCNGYFDSNFTYSKELWEYNPSTDSWTQKTDFPGSARATSVGFTIGTIGIVGTGNDLTSNNSNMWSYDQSTNAWTSIGNFPTSTEQLVSFVIGNVAYAGIGYEGTNTQSFYKFQSK